MLQKFLPMSRAVIEEPDAPSGTQADAAADRSTQASLADRMLQLEDTKSCGGRLDQATAWPNLQLCKRLCSIAVCNSCKHFTRSQLVHAHGMSLMASSL